MTRVVFKIEDGSTLAVFPEELATLAGDIMVYQHIGQHGAACPNYCATLPDATPSEYATLKAELERIGYTLAVSTLDKGNC